MSSKLGKIILGLAGLLVLLLLLGGVIFYVWLNRWLAGEECRKLISSLVSNELKIDGDFQPFHWSGFSVYSEGFSGKGRAGGALREIQVRQIRADLNFAALLEGTWEISKIDIAQIEADLGPAEGPAPSAESAAEAGGSSPSVPFLPTRFHLKKVKVNDVDLTWPAEPGKPGHLKDSRLQIESDGADWKFAGQGGKFFQPGLPELTVDQFQARFKPPEQLFVPDFRLFGPKDGSITGRGQAGFGPGGLLEIYLDLNRLDLAPFLTEDWRAKLSGKVSGPMELKTELGRKDGMKAKGSLKILEGKVEALPVLNDLAVLTQTREFRSLKLQTAQSDFEWEKNRLVLKGIVVESELLLKITGDYRETNGQVEGLLQVGTTAEVLRLIPGAKSKVFTRAEGGYLWTPVKLSGSSSDIRNDLTPRLKEAAVGAAVEVIDGGVKELNQGVDKAVEKTMDFLNQGLSLP